MSAPKEPPRAAVLAALLAQRYPNARPYLIACCVRDMQRCARAWANYEMRRCNEPMSEEQEEAARKRPLKLALKVDSLIESCGEPAGVSFQWGGDPRGHCASMVFEGEKGDGWGDGWAIYSP